MDYTLVDSGKVVASNVLWNFDLVREKAKGLGVSIETVASPNEGHDKLKAVSGRDFDPKADLTCWRYAFWTERRMLDYLKHKKKTERVALRYPALSDYYSLINNSVFLTQNIPEKVAALYTAFQNHPKLTASCATEMQGATSRLPVRPFPVLFYGKTFYDCEMNDLQVSAFIEHRARLALLKCAVDFCLFEKAGFGSKVTKPLPGLLSGIDLASLLPSSFRKTAKSLANDKFVHRYPIFWQWFSWVFGGSS